MKLHSLSSRRAGFFAALTLIFLLTNLASAVMAPSSPLKMPAPSPQTSALVGAMTPGWTIWTPMDAGKATDWRAYHSEKTGSIALAWGKPIPLVKDFTNDAAVTRAALAFVKANRVALGMKGWELRVSDITHRPNFAIVTVEPVRKGVAVYDAWVILSINQNGALSLLKARGCAAPAAGAFKLSSESALNAARLATGLDEGKAEVNSCFLPRKNESGKRECRASYQIKLTSHHPAFQPTVWIDGEIGEPLAAENRVTFLDVPGTTSGFYFPLYGRQEQQQGIFPDHRVVLADSSFTYSDGEGGFIMELEEDAFPIQMLTLLHGRFVEVYEFEGGDGVFNAQFDNPEEPLDVTWTEDYASPDERNLYPQINLIHGYWKTVAPDFNGMDSPIFAVCGVGGEGYEELEDNAMSAGQNLFFGRGNQCDNFAHYADVIYHEYCHSVTAAVYGGHALPYEEESGALNEAWSDYFPCSFTNDHFMGEGGLIPGNGNIRDLQNNYRYPDHITHEVHDDSRIISAAMWETRAAIGVNRSDSLFHFARYHYARDFRTYLADVFLTDDDDGDLTNGTPHFRAIYDCFYRHGITSIDSAAYIIRSIRFSDMDDGLAWGNGNGIFDPGETIRVDIEAFRAGQLAAQDNDNTVARIDVLNDGVFCTESRVTIPDHVIGTLGSTPEPLLFEIYEGIPTAFASLVIFMGSENGRLAPVDTIRIVLGQPEALLVQDGVSPYDRSQYFRSALESNNQIYWEFATAKPYIELSPFLRNFKNVVWFTGDARQEVLTAESRAALSEYLADGGNLLLTGQAAGDDEEMEEFFNTSFGVRNVADSVSFVHLFGVEGDSVAQGGEIFLIGGSSARNQRHPGVVAAIEPAVEIFHWDGEDDNLAAGVRCINPESGAKTVMLTFGLEGISGVRNSLTQQGMLRLILDWFNNTVSAPEPLQPVPAVFALEAAYPNPFNGRIDAPYSLTRAGAVELKVFDSLGRQVFSDNWEGQAGRSIYTLDATGWGNGSYLLQLQAEGKTAVGKVTLLK